MIKMKAKELHTSNHKFLGGNFKGFLPNQAEGNRTMNYAVNCIRKISAKGLSLEIFSDLYNKGIVPRVTSFAPSIRMLGPENLYEIDDAAGRAFRRCVGLPRGGNLDFVPAPRDRYGLGAKTTTVAYLQGLARDMEFVFNPKRTYLQALAMTCYHRIAREPPPTDVRPGSAEEAAAAMATGGSSRMLLRRPKIERINPNTDATNA